MVIQNSRIFTVDGFLNGLKGLELFGSWFVYGLFAIVRFFALVAGYDFTLLATRGEKSDFALL